VTFVEENQQEPGTVLDIEALQDLIEKYLKKKNKALYENYHSYRAAKNKMRMVAHDQTVLSDYIFQTKYARYNPKLKRRESWEEAVERVANMHLEFFSDKGVAKKITDACDSVRTKRVLPSMRSLHFGGIPILKNHSRLYNCAASPINRIEFFREYFFLSLSGCGCGFSVQKHHIACLPDVKKRVIDCVGIKHTVADSIEGWSNAIHILVDTWFR
jgi:ribonucleoside-diphosphate reductase alpha chain